MRVVGLRESVNGHMCPCVCVCGCLCAFLHAPVWVSAHACIYAYSAVCVCGTLRLFMHAHSHTWVVHGDRSVYLHFFTAFSSAPCPCLYLCVVAHSMYTAP